MSSRNIKFGAVFFGSVAVVWVIAGWFHGARSDGPRDSINHAQFSPEFVARSSPNPLFAPPRAGPGRLRKVARDAAIAAALQSLRDSTGFSDRYQFEAIEAFNDLDRAGFHALVPELMEIVKVNPRSFVLVESVLGGASYRSILEGEEDAALLMPYLKDGELRVRLVVAAEVANLLGKQAPPEVLHATIQGLDVNDQIAMWNSMEILKRLTACESGQSLVLDPLKYGADAQDVITALNAIAKNAPASNTRDTAAKMLAELGHGDYNGFQQ